MQSWCLPRYFDKVDYEEKRDCKGKYEISTLSLISEIERKAEVDDFKGPRFQHT